MSDRPDSDRVKLIRASAANLEYFFSRLQDASWLPFLISQGFFRNPPPPETGKTDGGQGWVRFPNWPESQYLARIAPQAPELVAEAIEQIPETSNPRVHQDIVTAASALPGELAARVAKREQRWLAQYGGHLMSFPGPAGDLLAHLAEVGESSAAFRLAGTLLRVSTAPEAENRSSRHRADALVSEWEYGKIVEAAWPPLMAADPLAAFRFLCHRLADVIQIGYVQGSSFDPTYMWRAAIEDHAQNAGHSLLDTLVDAVRDNALLTAERDVEGRDMVLAELGNHDAPLFRRIALFVVARCGSNKQVANALADDQAIDDFNVWHEYAELLRARFAELDAEQGGRILSLIAAGPNRELTAAQRERGVTREQFEARGRYWRLERYVLIEDHLSKTAKGDYETLVAEFGKPDHPTIRSVVSRWTGPTSPYSVEDLLSMGSSGTLEMLRTWSPEGGAEDPSSEGLGRILEGAVEKDAESFAKIATEFADLSSDYVRGLLGGLAAAAKNRTQFPWEPVLRLCQSIAEAPAGDVPSDDDGASNWLRRTTVGLLSEGLNEGPAEIPSEERRRVWGIVKALLEDPDPHPGRGDGSDPATVAINSVRGEAMHAAVRYALWVERLLEPDEAFHGIASLPEFASAVNRRLDPTVEPSLAIRAVLGQWFVQFVRMDDEWAASIFRKVFPSDPEAGSFFSAAWNAYVVFNQAWGSVFKILRETYELAVERFEEVDEEQFMAGNPREHLGEHLAHLRFSGVIDLDEKGIFARFWNIAPTEIRTHVIRDVGWSLEHGNPQLSEETRARIVETWEWIRQQAQEELRSLGAFGAWFGTRQLDDGWLLAQGRHVLQQGTPLDPDHAVFEALPRMARDYPEDIVEVLRLILITDREGWSVLGSVDKVREALATALDAGDDKVRSDAIEVLNMLGGRGMSEFRDLMPRPQS